jgi:hypothetical protein
MSRPCSDGEPAAQLGFFAAGTFVSISLPCCEHTARRRLPEPMRNSAHPRLFSIETRFFLFLLNASEKFNRWGFLTMEPLFAAGY